MKPEIMTRVGKPNRYDLAPQGSYCKVIESLSDEYCLYQQISANQEAPLWEYIGTYKKSSV